MGRIRIKLKCNNFFKIKTFLIIFIAIFVIIAARHFIGLHFKKNLVLDQLRVIVSKVERSLFYKSIETFGTTIAQNSKAYRVQAVMLTESLI